MMRDLEINKEEEDVDPSEAFLGLQPPYKAALRGDWDQWWNQLVSQF
jgi:hypothetical protein